MASKHGNLPLNRHEFGLLMEMVYLAEWIMCAQDVEPRPEVEPYRMLEQKIYSLADEFGLGDLIDADASVNEYFPSQKFEAETIAHVAIEEYEDRHFWSRLAEQLAERDLLAEMSVSRLDFDSEDVQERWPVLVDEYLREFERNGINRLEVARQ